MAKKRPLVDSSSHELARHWLMNVDYCIKAETADSASDCLEDATWDLADAIQHAIEGWLTDAIEQGRLSEALACSVIADPAEARRPTPDETK